MDELKKKTEAMLRAVLISSPRGIPLRRLDREYTSITFSPLPIKQLGFSSLEDYLRSIPHVVSFTRDRDGDLVLKGVASEADQHVAKLISKQKKPKVRKSAPARKPLSRSSFSSIRSPTGPRTRPSTRTVTVVRPSVRTQSSVQTKQSGTMSNKLFGPNFEVPPRMKKVLQQSQNAKTSYSLSRFVKPTHTLPKPILEPLFHSISPAQLHHNLMQMMVQNLEASHLLNPNLPLPSITELTSNMQLLSCLATQEYFMRSPLPSLILPFNSFSQNVPSLRNNQFGSAGNLQPPSSLSNTLTSSATSCNVLSDITHNNLQENISVSPNSQDQNTGAHSETVTVFESAMKTSAQEDPKLIVRTSDTCNLSQLQANVLTQSKSLSKCYLDNIQTSSKCFSKPRTVTIVPASMEKDSARNQFSESKGFGKPEIRRVIDLGQQKKGIASSESGISYRSLQNQ